MNEYNELIKRFTAIEDELIRLRKQRNYELFNLDESNIPRLRTYSQLISENKQAISLVEQNVSDVESSVTLLSQFTSFDNVVVVEASDDKTGWDKSKVYYDSSAEVYWYHDGTQWKTTNSPITAGLDTSIAQIQAKTAENEAEIALVAKSVTQNTEDIVGLETLTGQIDGEIKTVKTNLAEVTAKADENETAISLVAKSVTDIESDISGLESANKTLNESIAAIELKADDNAANIALVAKNVALNASDITGLQETTGNIDNELTTVKTNLATVETKADDAAASAELAAQSVTELEGDVDSLTKSVASVKATADSASASVSTIVTNIGSNGTVNAASIVAKINSAGSSVQIAADHISLKGKTIALTSDSINISSTYFNVATTGAVNCTSLNVSGNNSLINISGSNTNSSLIKTTYYSDTATYSYMSPYLIYVNNSQNSGNTQLYASGLLTSGYVNGYHMYTEVTPDVLRVHSGATNTDALYVYATSSGGVWGAVNSIMVNGTFSVTGTKSRVEQTEHYGNRLMYAFESPNPLYSDFGRASIADDGLCYVFIDPVFYECIDNNYDYFVFIQPESSGEFAVIERTSDHFIVQGTPGESFAWMLVTTQKGYSATRTEEFVIPEPEPAQTPDPENAVYDAVGDEILKEFENQLG